MNYYSTNRRAAEASLKEAVVRGLAPDRGLYMPGRIERLPESFFREMPGLSYRSPAAWPRRSSARMSMRTLCSA